MSEKCYLIREQNGNYNNSWFSLVRTSIPLGIFRDMLRLASEAAIPHYKVVANAVVELDDQYKASSKINYDSLSQFFRPTDFVVTIFHGRKVRIGRMMLRPGSRKIPKNIVEDMLAEWSINPNYHTEDGLAPELCFLVEEVLSDQDWK